MSWRTNAFVVRARNLGRALGVNKHLAVWLNGAGYEARYDEAFSSDLRRGDKVWDVGANVGYYTRMFAEKVGSTGVVCAFEPSPVNYPRLLAATVGNPQVTHLQVGLGSENGRLSFQQGADDLGATSRVVDNANGGIVVEIRTGANVIEAGDAPVPNAIKIDVEGFELEVLKGLGRYLEDRAVRVIGIEVHFSILKSRGMQHAPAEIERLLKSSGFSVEWPDSSHLLARRRT